MKGKYSQTYFQKMKTYNLFGDYSIKVNIDENPYNFEIDSLFVMAARKNIKRGFLFVSKLLGKHIPVIPGISILTGMLLGIEYYKKITGKDYEHTDEIIQILKEYSKIDILDKIFDEELLNDFIIKIGEKSKKVYEKIRKNRIKLSEKTLFIGFAETATALGNSVFEIFEGDIAYIHTTREYLVELKTSISFEEEHSHATEHFIYSDISKYDNIVFIDDEITTGNTICNFIKKIKENIGADKFSVLSILDWRNNNNYENLIEKENIKIEPVSILKGNIEQIGKLNMDMIIENKKEDMPKEENLNVKIEKIYINHKYINLKFLSSYNSKQEKNNSPYLSESGRFFIYDNTEFNYKYLSEVIKNLIKEDERDNPILFLGTGEFMYIPMKIAMDYSNALYHSTTRSPIFITDRKNYGARSGTEFENPYDSNMKNYFYNIKKSMYKKAFIFFERDTIKSDFSKITDELKKLEISEIFVIIIA